MSKLAIETKTLDAHTLFLRSALASGSVGDYTFELDQSMLTLVLTIKKGDETTHYESLNLSDLCREWVTNLVGTE